MFEGLYLLDSSDQVLDKQSSEVMEGLQLSALCGREKKTEKKQKQSTKTLLIINN